MIDFLVLDLLQELKKTPVFKTLTLADKKRLDEIMEFVSQGKDEMTLLNEVIQDPTLHDLLSIDAKDFKEEDDDLFDELEEEFAEGIFQFKVTLKGSKPPIWRRIQVDSYMTFHDLHLIIQAAMGWTNTHLYNFEYKGLYFEHEEEEDMDTLFGDINKLDSDIVALGEFLSKEGEKFTYTYDFGDNWEHTVILEKILPHPDPDSDEFFEPCCMTAKRACPPDDCGGIYGYQHLLEVLSGPDSHEKQELTEWLGDDYDSEKVDLEEINQILSNIFEYEDF